MLQLLFPTHCGCCRAHARLYSRCYPLSIAGSLMSLSFPSSSLFPRGGGQLLQLLMPNLAEKEWRPLGEMPKFWSGLLVWSKPPGRKPLWKLLISCHEQELVTSRTKRICWTFKKFSSNDFGPFLECWFSVRTQNGSVNQMLWSKKVKNTSEEEI